MVLEQVQLRRIPDLVWISVISWLGFALRLAHLGEPSLWLDEAFTWLVVSKPLRQGLELALADTVHPPLHYLLLHPVVALLDQSEFVLRLPSVVFGVVSIPVMYQLGRALPGEPSRGRRVGLLAAALLAINPFSIWFSREARSYELVFLLSLLLLYTFHQLLRGKDHWLAFTALSGLAYTTHYLTLLLAVSQAICLLWQVREKHRLLRQWLLAQALAVIPLFIWLRTLAEHGIRLGGIKWIPEPTLFSPFLTLWNFALLDADAPMPWDAVGLPIFLLALILGISVRQRRSLLVLWLIAPPMSALLFSLSTRGHPSLYLDRFWIISLPAFVLLLARGLGKIERKWARTGMTVALLLVSTIATARISINPRLTKPDWRNAMAIVARNRQPDDLLVLRGDMERLPAMYYQPNLEPWTSLQNDPTGDKWSVILHESLGRLWLVYTEADPATADWLDQNRHLVLTQHTLPGISVVLVDPSP